MKFGFDACGSYLKIEIFDTNVAASELEERCKKIVQRFEETYTRFSPTSFLSQLNTTKQAPSNPELVSLLRLASKVSQLTEWYFDITILPFLENRGYGVHSEVLQENYGSENIEITDTKILLHNDVRIDLGSLWKGYIIDVLYKVLDPISTKFIIDFGGDIRVKWKHTIMLEDPQKIGKIIWEIQIINQSIAASTPSKRSFGKSQHLMNPKNPDRRSEIQGTYAVHQKALFADIFATALFVSPLHISERILRQTSWISWCIYTLKGTKIQTKDFTAIWY